MFITAGSGGLVRVDVLTPSTFRIRFSQNGEFKESGLSRYHILHEPEQECAYETEEGQNEVVISTSKARLTVSREDGRVSFCRADGEKLLFNGKAPESLDTKGFKVHFTVAPEDRIYGMGDVTRDRLEKRGFKRMMWVANVAAYVPITFLMGYRGWGLLLNTTWRHLADICAQDPNEMYFHAKGGTLDYYLFCGGSYEEILNDYTEIAGKPVMLPLSAYGLTYVCNENVDAFQMLQDARTFRQENIPCDIIGLEPGWMEQRYDTTVEKKWSKKFHIPYWTDKEDLTFIGAAKRMGFKLSLWLCCEYDFSYYEEQLLGAQKLVDRTAEKEYEEDDFIKDVHLGHSPIKMDKITKEDEPWFEHLKKFVDQGAEAFKLDGAFQVNEHPDRLYGNGMTDEEMHNLYPALYNKQMSLGYKEHTGRRSMIYSSGGYTGIQQYSATWAGDTGGGPRSLVSLMNHGMSGHSNTSCDMDIFSMESIHFGFLQPWSQLNNWDYFHQPWYMGKQLERAVREYSQLRYRLLPYIYTAAHTAASTGMPIMRAMPLMYPDFREGDGMLHQYFLGNSLLVSAFEKDVYLPSDSRWIDFWTEQLYEGGQTLSYCPPEGKGGALFVKEGSVLPMWEPVDFVEERDQSRVELHIYGGAQGGTEIYEDDGVTYSYLEGCYGLIFVSFTESAGDYEFQISTSGGFEGWKEKKTYRLVFHGAKNVSSVRVNGEMVPVSGKDGLYTADFEDK